MIEKQKNTIYSKYILIRTKRNLKILSILKVFNIFIFINLFLSVNNYFLFIKNLDSQISLKIKGTGKQKIICHSANSIKISKIFLSEKNISSKIEGDFEIIMIDSAEENAIKIILEEFDGNINNGFNGISNATEIDLSQLNKPLKEAANLFSNCNSLVSLKLLNLNTSLLTNMGRFFDNCHSLISLNLSSFDTSKVQYMDHMFNECHSLTTLNLANFNTSSVVKIEYMFQNCRSLTTLDLSSFIVEGNDEISNMFIGCSNLKYLNIKNFKIPNDPKHIVTQNIIRNTTKNIVICLDLVGQYEAYNYLESMDKNCVTFNCSENWMVNRKKILDYSLSSCVNDCSTSTKKIELDGYCYDECPNGTFLNLSNMCEKEELIIENENETKICEANKFFMGKCKNNFITKEDKAKFKDNIISSIKDGSLTNLLLSKVNNESNLIIKDEKESYLISTLNNQMNIENLTAINFSECEKEFKGNDNDNNEEIYAFRIEHKIEGYLIPIIEYVIFNENNTLFFIFFF